MRRVLIPLLLLVASVAEAKVAVVVGRPREVSFLQAGYQSQNSDFRQWVDWPTAQVVGFLNRYGRKPGVDYDIYRMEQVQTSLVKDGTIKGQTYTAVIWCGVGTAITLSQNPVLGCWPCSLSLAASYPTVPQLFIGSGSLENMFQTSSTSCSLQVNAINDPNSQGPGFGDGVCFLPGYNYKFHRGWAIGQATPNTPFDGGWRTIIGVKEAPSIVDRDSTENVSFTLDKYTVTGASIPSDTAVSYSWMVGARLMRHINGASQIIECNWATSAVTRMDGNTTDPNENGVNQNGDPFFIYCALAYLDSLTNRDVIGACNPTPVRFAIQVEGVAARSSATRDGGMSPHDSTTVYASLDSISNLKVPVTFGVNLDSARTYQRDINLTRAVRLARFTPWVRSGIDSSAPQEPEGAEVEGVPSTTQLFTKDIFGRYRNRSFVRPFGVALADSDIRNLAQWARWRIDSIYGRGRFSGVAMCPDNDWSPKNITQTSGDVDSLVYALNVAGYRGISFDVEADTINTMSVANPIGRTMSPRFQRVIYGDHSSFGFLAFTRLQDTGSMDAWQAGNGTSDGNILGHVQKRLWMSAYAGFWNFRDKEFFTRNGRLQDWTTPATTTPYHSSTLTGNFSIMAKVSPLADINRSVNILRVSMAGLGSGPRGTGAPARPSWYAIKSLVNQTRVINQLAGRNLAIIVYDQDLGPDDLR